MHHPPVFGIWTCTFNASWHGPQRADAMLVENDTDPAGNRQINGLLCLGVGEVIDLSPKFFEKGKLTRSSKPTTLIHDSDSQGSADGLNLLPGPLMNRSCLDGSIGLLFMSWRSSETPPVGWEEPKVSLQPAADMFGATLEEATKGIGSWTTDNPIWQDETCSSMLDSQGLDIALLPCNASIDMLSLPLHEISVPQCPGTTLEAPSSQRFRRSGPCSQDCPPQTAQMPSCAKSAPLSLANPESLSAAEVNHIPCSASCTSLTANESLNQTNTTIRTPFHQRSSDDDQRMCFINYEEHHVELPDMVHQHATQPRLQGEICDAVADVCSSASSYVLVSRQGLPARSLTPGLVAG